MEEQELSPEDARTLRFLRILVFVLTATMIAGMALLIVLFWLRFSGREAAPTEMLSLPQAFELPAGETPAAVTRAKEFWVVVADDGTVHFFAPEGGAPIRSLDAPE
ncbi:DUF6476 family protein [Tropicimonas sp. TH_r6]|uniref:DUF6476 family protein n=1 Tax=Tropicimonas sp. TH_r6 TaxID=3082085 RepID=UPI002952D86D|nr:DUF6476 family protein [Tropicimonas sp. TH_r6]MDV7145755.1 DUF6476 family protein [Tropicimonas sp. TH_r6]